MIQELETVKKHLNVDFEDDDEYILSLMMVSDEVIARHLNVDSLESHFNSNVPVGVTHAKLLLIGTLYNNRETVTDARLYKVPTSYEYLLSLYQNYG